MHTYTSTTHSLEDEELARKGHGKPQFRTLDTQIDPAKVDVFGNLQKYSAVFGRDVWVIVHTHTHTHYMDIRGTV